MMDMAGGGGAFCPAPTGKFNTTEILSRFFRDRASVDQCGLVRISPAFKANTSNLSNERTSKDIRRLRASQPIAFYLEGVGKYTVSPADISAQRIDRP